MDKRNIAPILGLESEKQFELECLRRNIECYKSIAEYQSDYIINTNSKLYRIQVKSCSSNAKTANIKCSWGNFKSGWRSYTKDETDLLAVYWKSRKEWYLIPVQLFKNKIGITITEDGIYSKYKDNWKCLIKKPNITLYPTIAEIIELKKKGISNTKVARQLNISRSYVDRVLRQSGNGLKDRLNQMTEDRLRTLYFDSCLTIEKIAEHFSVSDYSVRKKFRQYNIKVKKLSNPYGVKGKTGGG